MITTKNAAIRALEMYRGFADAGSGGFMPNEN